MDLLPDTKNGMLRMRWECRKCVPRHWLWGKPLFSDPDMHHGTCVTHVPWCMSGSLTRGGGENVPGIPGACAPRNFAYLIRGPWWKLWMLSVNGSNKYNSLDSYTSKRHEENRSTTAGKCFCLTASNHYRANFLLITNDLMQYSSS